MMRLSVLITVVTVVTLGACGASAYETTTEAWTRRTTLRGQYQEAVELVAVFKSPEWRLIHAERDADHRGLTGPARDAVIAQAKADAAGPYEVEILLSTWDRRENDLDRGTRSVWRIVLIDDGGKEIEPLESIRKDKRPTNTLREEFPAFGDFATAYVAKFPRALADGTKIEVGDGKTARLRMSGERGGLEVAWATH